MIVWKRFFRYVFRHVASVIINEFKQQMIEYKQSIVINAKCTLQDEFTKVYNHAREDADDIFNRRVNNFRQMLNEVFEQQKVELRKYMMQIIQDTKTIDIIVEKINKLQLKN